MAPGLVSVIIPVFNRYQTLIEAIDSVRRQTHRPLEVVVADDGSPDHRIGEYCQTVRGVPMRYVRSERRQGPAGARNLGVRHASGRYVAFLDSDDLLLPHCIEAELRLFDREDVGIVACPSYHEKRGRRRLVRPSAASLRQDLLTWQGYLPSAWLVRRELFTEHGLWFDDAFPALEDWDFLVRALETFRIRLTGEPGLVYRSDGADRLSKDAERTLRGLILALEKHRRAIEAAGGLHRYYLWRAFVQAKAGHTRGCLADLATGIRLRPQDVPAWAEAAVNAALAGGVRLAMQAWRISSSLLGINGQRSENRKAAFP